MTMQEAENDLIEEVGLALREGAQSLRIRQSTLAEKIGKSQSHVSLALSGEQNMTLKSVAALAWACGLKVSISLEGLKDGR